MRQAEWIGPRLTRWEDGYTVSIVVPTGFEAYARVLHPAGIPEHGGRLVRWADVAAWSGLPLRADAQFHSVALPPADPGGPPPYSQGGPRDGSLYPPDAVALAAIARGWTATPEDCWFCVWDGFGWDVVSRTGTRPGTGEIIAGSGRDPVPGPVREGPRVRLPNRDYLLYRGPVEAAVTLAGLDGTGGQCPNLWWPADRAWCVATEIDLPWTYVGGPRGLIDAVLTHDQIEALPAAPDDQLNRVEDWVTGWADQLTDDLMARGAASLSTPRGSVDARLRRPHRTRDGEPHGGKNGDPHRGRDGELRIEITGLGGSGSSTHPRLGGDDDGQLRRAVHRDLTFAILDLTRM